MSETAYAALRLRWERGQPVTRLERQMLFAQNELLFHQLVRIIQNAQPKGPNAQ